VSLSDLEVETLAVIGYIVKRANAPNSRELFTVLKVIFDILGDARAGKCTAEHALEQIARLVDASED
jgi:hypothetical protein